MDDNQRDKEKDKGGYARRQEPEDIMPWRDIFLKPRATTRWLLARETAAGARTLWLSFTAFTIIMLFLSLTLFPGKFDPAKARMQLAMFSPVIFLIFWAYFLLDSYLLRQFCRVLGGRCQTAGMRVVVAYTTAIPGVVFGLAYLALGFLLGRGTLALKMVENVAMIWTVYITLSAIATAAGLSIWRTLAAYFASVAVWTVGAMILLKGLGLLLPRVPTLF